MFTALFMTRYFFAGWVQNPKNDHLTMSEWISNTNFDFLGKAKDGAYRIGVIILLAVTASTTRVRTLFGMDFTGGYSLQVEVEEKSGNPSYRLAAIHALEKAGATPNDIDVRELHADQSALIQLGMGIEEKGHPFYQMPEALSSKQSHLRVREKPSHRVGGQCSKEPGTYCEVVAARSPRPAVECYGSAVLRYDEQQRSYGFRFGLPRHLDLHHGAF